MKNGQDSEAFRADIEISLLQVDHDLQMREAGVDVGVVAEYAEAISDGAQFPPIIVFWDGTNYWPGDGFHRIEANKRVGRARIDAEVRDGGKREAILLAVGANANHGMRRTTADRRRSIIAMLRDPEWSKWSDREIGKRCAVDHKTVGKIRRELTSGEFPQMRTYERNGVAIAVKVVQREPAVEAGSMVERMLAKASDAALVAECHRRGMEVSGHED